MSWWQRGFALAAGLACFAVLIVAMRLTPSPTGMGTHTALGLQPCAFALRLGIPCPSCGMTTSFAWFVRGNLAASFYVQPMGCLLALATAFGFWLGFYIALTGRPVYRLLDFLAPRRAILPLMGLVILAWAWKIYIHRLGIDGWR